ncbi:hypothetical protein AALP_AA6G041000 [Arabis alpina]|uniref:Fe2OG dioxygenase domain-containing protein n=1 Tax=Arabis alpina TaxID=50452 RepID=A0A087GM00_ARAAL|nr:hypothetical protein AALP_AA6G041000 [Arabis alpina]
MNTNSFLPLSLPVYFQLPIIHFSDQTLKPGSSKWDQVKSDVRKALEDYGSFEASFYKVSMDLKNSVFEAMQELYDLPVHDEEQGNVSFKHLHGYLKTSLHEGLGVNDANVLEKVYEFTQQLWPDHGNKNISETLHKFLKHLSEVDVMVRRMIMESFGIEKYIDEHLNSTDYLFRMMKYTPDADNDDEEEPKQGLRSHTDTNYITILHQYQVDGFEMKTKDEKWIKVKPSPDHFLVMVGDSLSALLNGRLSSPHHRVMVKKTRYSTALFSVPKPEVIIVSPEELVDEEHPRIFKPFVHDDYLHFFHSEVGRRAPLALQAFCAI